MNRNTFEVYTYFGRSIKIAFDTNGNRIVKVSKDDLRGARGFSIQTLGNLPMTHRDGVGSHTGGEMRVYLMKYGTKRQKEALKAS
jgi:hypothetical protein